jgi:hypothetical protein
VTVAFFVVMCLLGGLGGFAGSVAGGAFGKTGLFVGGVVGGILIAPLSAKVALWRTWITPAQYWPTAIGAAVGFAAAATVAVYTLQNPVGPVLSTALIGIGALIGRRVAR